MKTFPQCHWLFLFLLALASGAGAQDFHWEAGTVSMEVKIDTDKLKLGQYLYITHEGKGAEDWNMAKLNVPDSWKIESVKVEGQSIRVITEYRGQFEITPKNLQILWNKLRKTRPNATDQELNEIWRSVAKARNP